MPPHGDRACSAEVGGSIAAAAKEDDAPGTCTRHRVKWTRVTSNGGTVGAFDFHAAIVEVADDVAGNGDEAEVVVGSGWNQREDMEEEMERVRLASTREGCDVDLPFLQTSHVESLQDSMCTTVHEMAKMAKTFTAMSKAEVKATVNLVDELATEIGELGEDAVSPPPTVSTLLCAAHSHSHYTVVHS